MVLIFNQQYLIFKMTFWKLKLFNYHYITHPLYIIYTYIGHRKMQIRFYRYGFLFFLSPSQPLDYNVFLDKNFFMALL